MIEIREISMSNCLLVKQSWSKIVQVSAIGTCELSTDQYHLH